MFFEDKRGELLSVFLALHKKQNGLNTESDMVLEKFISPTKFGLKYVKIIVILGVY